MQRLTMNERMAPLYDRRCEFSVARAGLAPKLAELLELGFAANESGVFLKYFHASCQSTSIEDHHDLTGFECWINKIYLSDFIETTEPRDEALLHQALLFSAGVRELWRKLFPTINITMVFSMAETLFEDEPNYIDGTWRLHTLRPGESWLADDLDDYETEGVLRIDLLASAVQSGSVAKKAVSARALRPR